MTTLIAYADTDRFDHFFTALVGFCADFCAGARQGGYPPSPPNRPDAPAQLNFVH